jgi:hypothetical protein
MAKNCTFRPSAKPAEAARKNTTPVSAPSAPKHPLVITLNERELMNAAHNAASYPAQILAYVKDRYKPLNYQIDDRDPIRVSINYELK